MKCFLDAPNHGRQHEIFYIGQPFVDLFYSISSLLSEHIETLALFGHVSRIHCQRVSHANNFSHCDFYSNVIFAHEIDLHPK